MRNISFALTTEQILGGTKTVTRRLGWERAKVGDLLRPVRKGMGLKPGEKVEVLRAPIRLVDVRREPLRRMTDELDYGFEECRLEGFGDHPAYRWPSEFVAFFCASHRPCDPSWTITRLQFEYTAERTGSRAMKYATPREIALVSWKEVERQSEFVKCRRGTGETGWWHQHKDDEDYGGNPMDDIQGILTCRSCGSMWIAGPSLRR